GVCRLFFFSSRRRHTRLVSDWSSDVCSSDLEKGGRQRQNVVAPLAERREVDVEDVQAIVEIRTEFSPRHRSAQMSIGRGDDADRSEERRGGEKGWIGGGGEQ